MNKKLLAVALATAFAAPAMAEGVQIYGSMSYGAAMRSGSDGIGLPGNATQQASTGSTALNGGLTGNHKSFTGEMALGNYIGFKGSEDLGNGTSLGFVAEFGFGSETATTAITRLANLSLSGNWGTLIGGRVAGARYSFTNMYDPFGGKGVANGGSIFGGHGVSQADYADNAIVYVTPELAPGLKLLGAYTFSLSGADGSGQRAGTDTCAYNNTSRTCGNVQLYAIAALYNQGPLSVTLDYENAKVPNLLAAGNGLNYESIYVAGASYDFGVIKPMAYYESIRDQLHTGKADYQGYMLGATAPVSEQMLVKASYVHHSKDNLGSCNKYGLGVDYNVSKRTRFFADVTKIENSGQAQCRVSYSSRSPSQNTGQASTNAATGSDLYGTSAIGVGVQHTF